MGFFSQLRLLLWKNFLLQRRKICVSVFEVILPIFFAVLILIIRIAAKPEEFDNATYYQSTPVRVDDFRYAYMGSDVEVGFTPNTSLTRRLMQDVERNLDVVLAKNVTSGADLMAGLPREKRVVQRTLRTVGFQDETSLVDHYRIHSDKMQFGIVFQGLGSDGDALPDNVMYYVRPITGDDDRWRTRFTFPFFQTNEPRQGEPDYQYSGFLLMQALVGEALVREKSQNASLTFDLHTQRMPFPPYFSDPMVGVLQQTLPLFLILSFILSVIQCTKSVVYEKERKLKESMKLMGLMPSAHWASWFITSYVYLAVAMGLYTLLFGLSIFKDAGPVLAHSDPSLFYVFLLCYAASIVSFCFMISVFVQKANVGAVLSGLFFFAFYLPNFFLIDRYEDMTSPQKYLTSILFNMAMAFGANVIGLYEGTGEGAQWNNFHKPASVDDNFSLLDAMLMLLIDTVIHLVITWYVDNVRPGEFGVPKPFYFCFTKSYWCGSGGGGKGQYHAGKSEQDERHFERDPTGLKAGIKICNLTRKFGQTKVAVDNLSLNMYEGQITVLLGHNGAGKTTTMSMLTGFLPPSSGTAYINDQDIRTDIESVRESLGLCPQHNILFGLLTVEEHLTFFAKLKGMESRRVKEEVDVMMREVGLELKRSARVKTLSGGQKRKLSVGIALIGGSRVVVLDEPTSGMDPAARRQTWDVLQRQRAGRTLLLTTHFMDEADVLGDRIAIMAEGVVKCCGTSMFLKKLYGAGYHLVLVKSADCKVASLTHVIQEALPGAQFESEINAELSYLLPDEQSALFPDLFRMLENRKEELGIQSFGATATTMEEVFLKVGESAMADDEHVVNRPLSNEGFVNKNFEGDKLVANGDGAEQSRMQAMSVATDNGAMDILAFTRGYRKLEGAWLVLSRVRGILVKKAIHFWRNRTITLVQLILPVVFTIIALAVDKARPDSTTEPSRIFDLEPFGSTVIPYSNGSSPDSVTNAMATAYSSQFGSSQTPEDKNLAENNMSYYLLQLAETKRTPSYNKEVVVGAVFDTAGAASPSGVVGRAYYNGQPYHAHPISLVYLLNGLARYHVGDTFSIASGINPLPKDEDADARSTQVLAQMTGFSVGFNISIGMAFLTSLFIFFLIKERAAGAKHLQSVSGVGPCVFWLSNLAWDYASYLLPSALLLAVFAAYGTEAYSQDGRLGLVFLVLVIYGWAILPLMYFVQFMFTSAPTGLVVVVVFNIVSGLITTVAVFVMNLLEEEDLADVFNWIFTILFPNYCMARAFMDIYTNYVTLDSCEAMNYNRLCQAFQGPCCKGIGVGCKAGGACLPFSENYLAWDSPGVGKFLVFMALHGALYLALTLLVEYRLLDGLFRALCGRSRQGSSAHQPFYINGASTVAEDDDVATERRRINASPASVLSQSDSLLLVNLYRQFGGFVAVDHICVGVPEQECFGLLGQNGAGKTTTFKMLTGDVVMTGGNAYLKGYDVKHNLQQVHANMGYCPQFDALIEQMTGRETLTMYARLRGVPESSIKDVVNSLIDILLLRPHADKMTGLYSGGNKRKLSTAMALVGDPHFILLDEPSSGMDPAARRQLWNVLSQVRASGRTLVLTSHSMEECEALCTRIAIMVNGRFMCLGSTQHLKSKFGQGYTLIAQMDAAREDGTLVSHEPFVQHVQTCFPSARIFDMHQGYVHMQVPDPDVHLADVFTVMERAKRELHVQDYTVHQTTLEQVFLAFTRQQTPSREVRTSCIARACFCCGNS